VLLAEPAARGRHGRAAEAKTILKQRLQKAIAMDEQRRKAAGAKRGPTDLERKLIELHKALRKEGLPDGKP
jgi:hypothetical protein